MIKKITLVLAYFLLIGHTAFSQDKSVIGEWSEPIPFGMVPVAVANLPDGNLICWSSKFRNSFTETEDGATWTQLFDYRIGENGNTITPDAFLANTDHDMFCPGINNLADGRILSAGGTSSERTSIFDPQTGLWTVAEAMNIPRGYQGNVTLSDGSVFTVGGSWSDGSVDNGGKDAEVWSPLTGWITLSNIQGEDIYNGNDLASENQGLYRVDNHVWLWPAPNGHLFHAGPGERMHWIDVSVPGGNIVDAGLRGDATQGVNDAYSMKGNTVMFDVGKILKTGGAPEYGNDHINGLPARQNSFVIDLNGVAFGDVPNVSYTGLMSARRTMHNSTVLPNGEVLITGGLQNAEVFQDTGAVLGAEIFNPNATSGNNWRSVAAMDTPRTYHSVAILLPNGKVFVGGGGLCDNTPGCVNHFDAEIYSPPYLFNGNALATRPVITNVDSGKPLGDYSETVVDYNSSINVTTDIPVAEFSLIRFSAATHSTNNEQRRIPLSTTPGTNHSLNIPDRNLLPPGFYMLFALDTNGVPSEAATLKIGDAIPLDSNPNLVWHLKFDETEGSAAFDSSQYNHNALIIERFNNGNPTSANDHTWVTEGLFDGALELDGLEFESNTLVQTNYTAQLATIENEITVSAWVWRDSDGIAANGKLGNLGVFTHDYPAMFAGFHNTLLKWSFQTENGFVDCYSGYAPTDAWVHIAVTYDGQNAKLYANGEEICSKPITGKLVLRNDGSPYSRFTTSGFYDDRPLPVIPSGNSSGITDELDGKIDELQVYNKAFGPSEIQSLFQLGQQQGDPTVPNCPDGTIVAEYKIGDGNWIEGNNINAPEGSQIFIRAKNYAGEYFVTTPQFDGPTFSSLSDLNGEGAYQIDTNVNQLGNPERNNGLVDSSNNGQFVLTTPQGCPEVININVIGSCDSGDTQVTQQYNINGTWCNSNNSCGESQIYYPTGTNIIVSGLPDNSISVTITLPDGTQRPDNYAFTLNASTEGVYVITSNEGCAATLEIILDNSGNLVPIANAGADQNLVDADLSGSENVTLDGSASSDADGNIVSYSWSKDGSEIATGASPVVDLAVGVHTLTLTVTDNGNLTDTDTVTITVEEGNIPPVADAGADQNLVDADLSGSENVTLDGSASSDADGNIVSYSWSKDGSEIATGASPVVDLAVGVHTLTLTVTDDGNLTDTDTVTITVEEGNIPPVADAGADQNLVDADLSGSENVTLDGSASSDADGSLASYSWSKDGSEIATGASPVVDLAVGVHTLTLTVTDDGNLTDTDTVTITVEEGNIPPVADAGADQNLVDADLSGSENVTLDGSASSDADGSLASYSWSKDGSEIAKGASPVVDLAVGVHTLTLTVTDNGNLTDTDTVTITVEEGNIPPVADAGADQNLVDADLSGSENVTLDGSASSDADGSLASYSWSKDGSEIATGASPVVDLAVGVHTLTLTVTDDGNLTDTDTVTITVEEGNIPPVADAGADQNLVDADLSGSENVTLDGSASSDADGSLASYSWSKDGSEIATGASPVVDLAVGVHTLTLTVTDDGNLTDTDTVTITVEEGNIPPVADAGADQNLVDADLSGSENVTLDGSASSDADGSLASYSWSKDGSEIATGASPVVDLAVGVHTLTLTVTDDGNLTDTDTVTITVEEGNIPPVAVASATPLSGDAPLLVDFTGSNSTDDSAVTSYSWDFADGSPLDANADTSHTFNTAGTYQVLLTVSDAEGLTDTTTITITVNDPVVNDPPVAVASATPLSGDVPLLVDFTGSDSTDDSAVTSYSWDFADGSPLDANADTSHTFNTAGDYQVLLTVSDAEGLTDTTTITITVNDPVVNEPPVAVASATPLSGDAPLLVDFTGSNSTDDSAVTSYSWDFADGSPLDANADTSHTFNTAGTYQVLLTVTDAEGLTDATSITISVNDSVENEPPVAVASASPLSGDAPLLVDFTGSNSTDDSAVTSYSWDFADGSPLDANADTSHTFNTAGTYQVLLTVSDAEGLTDTTIITISVNDSVENEPPVAVASATPLSGDAPLLVNFTGSGSTDDSAITSYRWDFADGSPLDANADTSHTFNTAGDYQVLLTVMDAEGLTDTTTITITVNDPVVNDPPVAVASATPLSGDAPLLVDFTGSNSTDDSAVTSYSWDFADGSPLDANADTSHTFNTAGTYQVLLTVTDAEGLTDATSITISVNDSVENEPPVAVASASPLSGDAPLLVDFTGSNSTDDSAVTSYSWDFADGSPLDANADTSHTFNTAGTYQVLLTVTDAEGLTDTTIITISVNDSVENEPPVAVASATPLSGDAPLLVNFTGSGSTDDSAITSYRWDFGDFLSASGTEMSFNYNADTSYTFNHSGTYLVTLTVTDAQGLSDSVTLTIKVNGGCPPGSINAMYINEGELGQGAEEITVKEGTSLLLTTIQGESFTITNPKGELIEGNLNIKYFSLDDAGVYTFTNSNGCSYDLLVNFDFNEALQLEQGLLENIKLFPNPFITNQINIDLQSLLNESLFFSLFDVQGKLLQKTVIPKNHPPILTINLPTLNVGVYQVYIGYEKTGEVVVRKIIKN